MIDFKNNHVNGKPVFSQAELSLILGVYGDRVKRGIWRDYAIDSVDGMAVFSVFRSSKENPAYTIAKVKTRGRAKPSQYEIYSGNTLLAQGLSLADVLGVFDDLPA